MDITVQSVHFDADATLVQFCEKKVGKLELFCDGIINGEVILRLDQSEVKENKVSSVRISIPGNDYLIAKKQAATFEEATDLAVEAVRRQLKRYKEKIKTK